jgi:hypothetical protein
LRHGLIPVMPPASGNHSMSDSKFMMRSMLLPTLVSMLARLGSRLNRPAQIAALLVRKILGTPE